MRLISVRRFSLISALLVGLMIAVKPAGAQTTPLTAPVATGPYGMPLQDWQGLSCLWGGVLAGGGVFVYSDVLTVAATGATSPLLLVPLIATGFIAGCSVGTNAAPGLVWLSRRF